MTDLNELEESDLELIADALESFYIAAPKRRDEVVALWAKFDFPTLPEISAEDEPNTCAVCGSNGRGQIMYYSKGEWFCNTDWMDRYTG